MYPNLFFLVASQPKKLVIQGSIRRSTDGVSRQIFPKKLSMIQCKYITVFCQSKPNKIPPEAEIFWICSTLSIKKASLQQSTSLDNKIKYITVFCQSKQPNKIPPEAENFSICSTLSIKKCLSSFTTIYDTVVGCRNKNHKVVWNPSVFGVQTIWHIIFLAYNIFQKEFAI